MDRSLLNKALRFAEELQNKILEHEQENNQFIERMQTIVSNPEIKLFLIKMTDNAFRSNSPDKTASYIHKLIQQTQGYEKLFTGFETMLVKLFMLIGHRFPALSVPEILEKIKEGTESAVLLHHKQKVATHIQEYTDLNIISNVNLIGEALLGEKEAKHRISNYKKLLDQPEIRYISIKISTIYSQIDPLAYEQTLNQLEHKLSDLYAYALLIEQQSGIPKFINLDMEEYRDLHLTVDLFMRVLDQPAFKNYKAGIVMQAYVPDSFEQMKKLQQWAKVRVSNGGAPIKIRLVKGANMEMEKTEASFEQWEQVTFKTKLETDAHYKKMMHELIKIDSLESVHVGIASHNIFDLAYAISLSKTQNIKEGVHIEMLQGMAPELVEEMLRLNQTMVLYTPIVEPNQYNNAIAYLVRRLDEGTTKGNFLREGIDLKPQTEKWAALVKHFVDSWELSWNISSEINRKQNRNTAPLFEKPTAFVNAVNTDFSLKENQQWALKLKEKWAHKCPTDFPEKIPVKYKGVSKKGIKTIDLENYFGTLPWQYELASKEHFQKAYELQSNSKWKNYSIEQRAEILFKVAHELELSRGDLIGVAANETGKLIREADIEVSEAIDFANFYAFSLLNHSKNLNGTFSEKGFGLVLSPWNFPIAIPAGGILASLIGGNRVVLKPSLNAAATAYKMCECLWKAGVPDDALFFMPCEESKLKSFLSRESGIFDYVILTGGTDTAELLLKNNPNLELYAETGGKNAMIISAMSDRDLAIKDVIQSAFGNTGQKCSATSLLILEEEVFNDKAFKETLIDAVSSLKMGDPWDFDTKIGPLATRINKNLIRSFSKNRNWVLRPTIDGSHYWMTPGIKWGISSSNFEYNNELFGPVLSVLCAKDIDDAIELANGVQFGLTSGIHSLNEDEIEQWKQQIEAGNKYINRSTTGAIVNRQPFGGIKKSSFGPGLKAGGENYVLQFVQFEPNTNVSSMDHAIKFSSYSNLDTEDRKQMILAEKTYLKQMKVVFSKEIDPVQLRGQDNIQSYHANHMVVYFNHDADFLSTYLTLLALKTALSTFDLYVHPQLQMKIKQHLYQSDILFEEVKLSSLQGTLHHKNRIRYIGVEKPLESFLRAAHEKGIHIYDNAPSIEGRIELLNYFTEQSLSHNFHRYGNLMGRNE